MGIKQLLQKEIREMISGYSNERVSYRTRYLNFPSTMTESVPSINVPTVHVIKIRFNNIFKNEKILFAVISVALSICSLLAGYALYSMYKGITSEEAISSTSVAMDELNSIQAEDTSIGIMNKSGMPASTSSGQQGGTFLSYNDGGGIDPNSMLIASSDNKTKSKEILTTKNAIIPVDDKIVVNPFLPAAEVLPKAKSVKINPNYILPPTSVSTNSDANLLMNTSVSGIMYDKFSPSAIINIQGIDYLVKRGDVIHGFKILAVNNGSVLIQRGANVYTALVGRTLASLNPNNTSTARLNQKFGGSSGIDKANVSYKKNRK